MPKHIKVIKANCLSDTLHRTTAQLTFVEDDGSTVTDDFTVVYRGLSPRLTRELKVADIEGSDNRVEIAAYLAIAVKSLPEVIGEDGKPVELDRDFFDAMETTNLQAIFKAVQEGFDPPTTPSEV